MSDDLALQINGQIFAGWKSVVVHRAMDQVAGGFDLSVSEKWSDEREPFPIHAGDACTVLIDDDPVITGYIDAVERSYSATDHEIRARGRDKTADLVDCSAEQAQWFDLKMERIVERLIKPFGIELQVAVTDTGSKFVTMGADPGEAVFDVIERMARLRGLLLMSDGRGRLVITRRSDIRIGTELVLGQNVLSADFRSDVSARFSNYTVKGYHPGGGAMGDGLGFEDFSLRKGAAIDDRVKRYRPLVIVAEDQGDAATFKKRAEWERGVRAGRAAQLNYTVNGFRHADDLWRPNYLVRVRDPMLGIEDDMLIVGVRFTDDDQGQLTQLALTYPTAFDLIPMGNDRDVAWDQL